MSWCLPNLVLAHLPGAPTMRVCSSPKHITQKKLFSFPLQAREADCAVDAVKAGAGVFSGPTATQRSVQSVVGLSVCQLLCWHKQTLTGTCYCPLALMYNCRSMQQRDNLAKQTLWPMAFFIGYKPITLLAAVLKLEES